MMQIAQPQIFQKASTLNESRLGNLTLDEINQKRYDSGIKNFKRRILGFCGNETLKSPDELAIALFQSHVTDSLDEALRVVPSLDNTNLRYGSDYMLSLIKTLDHAARLVYKIALYDSPERPVLAHFA